MGECQCPTEIRDWGETERRPIKRAFWRKGEDELERQGHEEKVAHRQTLGPLVAKLGDRCRRAACFISFFRLLRARAAGEKEEKSNYFHAFTVFDKDRVLLESCRRSGRQLRVILPAVAAVAAAPDAPSDPCLDLRFPVYIMPSSHAKFPD